MKERNSVRLSWSTLVKMPWIAVSSAICGRPRQRNIHGKNRTIKDTKSRVHAMNSHHLHEVFRSGWVVMLQRSCLIVNRQDLRRQRLFFFHVRRCPRFRGFGAADGRLPPPAPPAPPAPPGFVFFDSQAARVPFNFIAWAPPPTSANH